MVVNDSCGSRAYRGEPLSNVSNSAPFYYRPTLRLAHPDQRKIRTPLKKGLSLCLDCVRSKRAGATLCTHDFESSPLLHPDKNSGQTNLFIPLTNFNYTCQSRVWSSKTAQLLIFRSIVFIKLTKKNLISLIFLFAIEDIEDTCFLLLILLEQIFS